MNNNQKKSPIIPIMLGVIGVLLIAVIVVLILFLTKKDEPAAQPAPAQQAVAEQPAADQPEAPAQDNANAEEEWTMPPGGGNSEGEEYLESAVEEEMDEDDLPSDHDNQTYLLVTEEKLTSSYVSGLNSQEKRFYVNTLYAAYGYRFSNKQIQEFFDSQEWYNPDTDVKVGDQDSISRKFNDIAKHNLKLLKS